MFAWAPIPAGFKDSESFVLELMEKTGMIVTPGSSFGPLGEGHVRFALVLPPETIREEFYRLNPETLTCGDYTIVVFEDNQAMRSLGASLMDAGK
jgi:hypothetical protein